MIAEEVYRYPRLLRWPIEVLSAAVVFIAAALAGRMLLRYGWFLFGMDTSLFNRVPFLSEAVILIRGGTNLPPVDNATLLLPSLGWLALALLLTLLLRNAFPTIRTGARGMLVEFSGDWLPIPWENVKSIKVTEDLSAERFVLLAETDRRNLTGWHWFYSLIYGFGIRPGFWITSGISNFDSLVKTLLSETDRVARVLENVKPAQLQEESSSPLFRFLLGPASFFSQRTKTETEVVAATRVSSPGAPVGGTYPSRITSLLTWGTTILLVGLLVRYGIYWLEFLALTFADLRRLPVFNQLDLRQVQLGAPWWLLVAAHLLAVLMISFLVALRHLLPQIEARSEGLAVRYFNNWKVVPWSRITAIKVTEFSENSQAVLIQTAGHLPFSSRLNSMIYHGGFAPSVLVTSALSNFEPLMQRIVLEVTRHNAVPGDVDDNSPILQDTAYSPLLLLSFRTGDATHRLVKEIRTNADSKLTNARHLMRAASPMIWLALLPTLLALAERLFRQGLPPDSRFIAVALILFLVSMLEWPLVSLGAIALDDMTGGGEEGNRPLYLYPMVQLPRILPMIGALVFLLLGVPILPMVLWLGAILWSFLLTAGLWGSLYDWRGQQLLAGSLIPVLFQLLILMVFLIAL